VGVGPLSERGIPPPPQKGYHRLERTTELCIVGFDVSGDVSCPLYQSDRRSSASAPFWKWRAASVAGAGAGSARRRATPLNPVSMAREGHRSHGIRHRKDDVIWRKIEEGKIFSMKTAGWPLTNATEIFLISCSFGWSASALALRVARSEEAAVRRQPTCE
jgi:hypothetical protein